MTDTNQARRRRAGTREFATELSAALAIEVPPTVVARPLGSTVHFARFASHQGDRRVITSPRRDEFTVVLALIDSPAREVRHDGRHLLKPAMKSGQFNLVDRSLDHVSDMVMHFDSVHMQFSKAALEAVASEQGGCSTPALRPGYPETADDELVASLGRCLLPALERPAHASRLFVDSVATALLSHLAATYGDAVGADLLRGGLTPRQLARAQEMIVANLAGDVTLEQLAGTCGLSRSHFARAFKRSTGVPPHRWLVEQRLKRAQELMLNSGASLAEIAHDCGFADQSHFTRSFAAASGVVPSAWRRQRRY